jgi:hypothetical protein
LLGSFKRLPQPPLLEADVLEADVLEADVLEADVLDVLEDDPPPLPAPHWHGRRWFPSGAHTCTPADPPGQAQPTCAPGMQRSDVVVPPPEPVPTAPLTMLPPPQPWAADHASTIPPTAIPTVRVRTRARYHRALPPNGRPVTEWPNQDAAWTDVAKGIRRAVEDVRAQRR